MGRVREVVTASVLVFAGLRRAHAETIHLEKLNIDVEIADGQNVEAEPNAKTDGFSSDLFVLRFGSLGETCPEFTPDMGAPTTEYCPAEFTCVGDGKGNLGGKTLVPGYGCLYVTAGLVEPTAGAAMTAMIRDVRAKVESAHIARVAKTVYRKQLIFSIRDPREWDIVILPDDDADAPGGLLLRYSGAPEGTGVVLTPRPAGQLCAPLAPGLPFPHPAQRETATRDGVTKGCMSHGDTRWNFTIRAGREDEMTSRRWAIPALLGFIDALEDLSRAREPARSSGSGERPFWGMFKLWAAGARIEPEIEDAGAFGAGRVGTDLVLPVSNGRIAPAISFGTSLGLDGSLHAAADIYLGFGLGTQIGGLRLFGTAVAGTDRNGPDSSFTFGLRGYLGVTADAHIPLGVGSLDVDVMLNTVEKRLAAGLSPRGVPLGAGLMLHAYDQSSAVLVFVAITEEGLQ